MHDQLEALKSRLAAAQSILLTLADKPSQDVVAAALALYLSIKQSGKSVSVIAASAPLVRDSHLVGLDKITTEIGGNNLVITLDVPENTIDKVTSNTDGGHLNLVISPAKGMAPITASNVKFATSGASADLVIVVGAADLSDLGSLMAKEPLLFSKENLVNISNQVGEFAEINLTDPSSSNSELVTALLKELALPLDVDIANNLMQGIENATDGLSSPNMTADTFEALAILYRAGARRTPPVAPHPEAKIVGDMPIVDHGAPVAPAPVAEEAPQSDWLAPKIFKSSSQE